MRKTKKKAGRRRNHEGSVSKRKDGRFQASKMIKGKRVYFYSYEESECYRWLDEMKVKEFMGMPVISGDEILINYVYNYIERYAKPYVRSSTLKNYIGYTSNYIEPSRLGKMKMRQISTDDVQDFINEISRKGFSGKTICNVGSFLDTVISQAVRSRLIFYNPCNGIRYPKKNTKERPLISEEEFNKLVDSADNQQMKTAIMILGEGLRISELLGLQWKDIKEVEGMKVLNIAKALKREYLFDDKQEKITGKKTKIKLSEPKTDTSVRIVPMTSSVMEELDKLKAEQKLTAEKLGIKFSEDYFIIGSVGMNGFSYTTPDKFRKEFSKCVERAGMLKTITPHALRRYTASTLIRNGVSPVAVAKLLGHSSSHTTLTYYSRESLSGVYDAIMTIDNMKRNTIHNERIEMEA